MKSMPGCVSSLGCHTPVKSNAPAWVNFSRAFARPWPFWRTTLVFAQNEPASVRTRFHLLSKVASSPSLSIIHICFPNHCTTAAVLSSTLRCFSIFLTFYSLARRHVHNIRSKYEKCFVRFVPSRVPILINFKKSFRVLRVVSHDRASK